MPSASSHIVRPLQVAGICVEAMAEDAAKNRVSEVVVENSCCF